MHLRRLQIASTPLFHTLDAVSVAHLADQTTLVEVARGEVVMREGELSDCLYLVATGSLEVFRAGPPASAPIDVLGEGALVGEMGVLLQDRQSLSVRARRDSTLLRMPAEVFTRVLDQHAPVSRQLARRLSGRLKRTTVMATARPVPVSTIAVWRACEAAAFETFQADFRQAWARAGRSVTMLTAPSGDAPFERERLAAALATAEQVHEIVVCVCDPRAPEFAGWSALQADLLLIVADAGAVPSSREGPPELPRARANGTRVEVALLRGAGATPRDTASWLDATAADAHHQLVAGAAADCDRLVRRLAGRAWGLVLGGGGARGFAHIGVIRALREAGMPIDMIGGTSMGAILAFQYAMGADDGQMLEMTRHAYVTSGGARDYTMPLVALRTGRGTMRTLRTMFGDRRIEDLPTACFCISSNLTRARVETHDRGPAWFWARVSCSVPGLLPPVPYRGDLLVDGGLLDNLPVAEMRRRIGGRVCASDVSVDVDLEVDGALAPDAPWSGSGHLLRLLSGRPRLPSIADVLMRAAEISSVRDAKAAGSPADLYLDVPMDGIAMSDFGAIDRIVALGYDYTARRIEEHRTGPGRDAF